MANTAFGETQVAELTPMAGWTFAYNVNADLVTTTLTGTGAVTSASGFAVLSTSAAINSSAKIETKLPLRYIPGQGALLRFTAIFTTGVAGSTQIIGVGDANDGLYFGYNGATFGVMRRYAGTDNWTPFDEWSNGVRGGNVSWVNLLDWTKGNIFQIQFQWLGFGEIKFGIENPASGELTIIHRIRFANTSITTSLQNPTLPIMAQATNTTNNTAIILKTPSAMGFCEGKIDNPTPPHPLSLPRTLTATRSGVTTQANILTISSPSTWLTKTNRIRAQLGMLSVAVDGTKVSVVKITRNTTLGGSPSYTAYSADASPIEYDVTGTTLTGGNVVFAATLDKADSQVFDLRQWALFLNPGEKLTVSVTSTASTVVDVAINWVDLL